MAEPDDGDFMRCEPFDDVVNRDIRWTADEDPLLSLEQL